MSFDIFKNYEAFYTMTLSSTMLTNSISQEFLDDSKEIINYIGKAYCLNDSDIEYCRKIIQEELVELGLLPDQKVIYKNRTLNSQLNADDALFDIKGEVLAVLDSISNDNRVGVNPSWFDYSHYKTYQADVRFYKINAAAQEGELICKREVGMMYALGIGVKQSLEKAIQAFKQCSFWGDIPSMYLLGYAYSLNNDEKQSKIFYETEEIANEFLKTGVTTLPDAMKEKYSNDAIENYIYISSITQDVIRANELKFIDYSFLEAITSDSIDYYKRMEYIDNYLEKKWKSISNTSIRPEKKFGFK